MEEVLCARGWEPMVAAVAARSMTEPGAIGVDRKPTLEGLQAVADLRRRYFPDWRSPVPLGELIAA
jgi:hypothetical protein